MDHFGSDNSYGTPSSFGNTVIVEGSIDVTICPSHSWQVCKPVNGWWKTEEIVGPFAAERCGWWGDGQTEGSEAANQTKLAENLGNLAMQQGNQKFLLTTWNVLESRCFTCCSPWFWVYFTTILYKDNNSQNKKNAKNSNHQKGSRPQFLQEDWAKAAAVVLATFIDRLEVVVADLGMNVLQYARAYLEDHAPRTKMN